MTRIYAIIVPSCLPWLVWDSKGSSLWKSKTWRWLFKSAHCTNVILSNTDMHPVWFNLNAWFMHGDWICTVGYVSCLMAIHSAQCLTFQDKNTSSPWSVPRWFRTCIIIHDNAWERFAPIIPALQLNMYQRYSKITPFAHTTTATVLTCLEHDASLLPSFLKPQLTEGQLQKCI